MIRSFCIVIFVLLSAQLHSKRPQIVTTARIDSVLELSYSNYAMMDIDSSLIYALEALSLSESIDYSKGKARSNFNIAQVMWSLGDNEKTLDYLQLAENEPYVASDLILLSEICRVKGRTYGSMKLYELSTKEFHKGLRYIYQIDGEFERKYLASLAYDNLSFSYSLQNSPDSAFFYLQKNKKLLESMDEERIFRNMVNLYGQIGNGYNTQAEHDSAVYYFNKALSLAEKYNYPYTSWIYLQWGNIENGQGDIDAALEKYSLGLENLKKTKLKNEFPGLYAALRDIYIQKKNYDSALVYQEKITTIENELKAANMKALDKAVHILLDEEEKQRASFVSQVRAVLLLVFLVVGLLAFAGWIVWRKRYLRVTEIERELEEVLGEKITIALEEVISLAKENDRSFLPRFMELFPEFTQNIYQRHPTLSQSSFQFCTYLFLHFSSKEIADCLYIEHKSVQTRKNRLRKQLELPHNTDLYQYMRSLDESFPLENL